MLSCIIARITLQAHQIIKVDINYKNKCLASLLFNIERAWEVPTTRESRSASNRVYKIVHVASGTATPLMQLSISL